MTTNRNTQKASAYKTVPDFRRAIRNRYSAEETIRIVLEDLRGERSIAELCRCEGIKANMYYRWSKEFFEAGTGISAGDFGGVVFNPPSNRIRKARRCPETKASSANA